jgi:nitrous oxidase accessory protein NosD
MQQNTKKKLTALFISVVFLLPACSRSSSYDIYVNKDATGSAENGSQEHPFKTISAALDYIDDHDLDDQKVYIKNGTYKESIRVERGTELYGQDKKDTVIDADDGKHAIEFDSTNSTIEDMTIENAKSTNVVVDKKSKVEIKNCRIRDAGKYGIEVKESDSSDKHKFTIENSEVTDSKKQGIYVMKRRIKISKNEIIGNDEEGIDLHQAVKGSVSNNTIKKNKESGIEAILAGANLNIKKNKITENKKQGITIQVYSTKKGGKVKLWHNTVQKNKAHGVRFANYTKTIGSARFKVFVEKFVKLTGNKISLNKLREIYFE